MVIGDLDIGPRRTQVGVTVFSSFVYVTFSLNSYSNREALTSAVNGIPYLDYLTITIILDGGCLIYAICQVNNYLNSVLTSLVGEWEDDHA